MKTHVLLMCATLAIGASAQAQNQTGAQGNAAAGSQTSVSATEDGASASSRGAASANAETDQAAASLAGGTELNATLTRPVDASKNKPGDEVTATAAQDVKSGGRVVIPRGSKLIGRVTKAQPRSKGASAGGSSDSQLGVVFERALLKDGREIPLNATVQAVAAARSAASAGMNTMDARTAGAGGAAAGGGAGGGGVIGGVTGTATGAVSTVAGAGGAVSSTVGGAVSKSAGATGGLNAAGRLTSGSKGVFGLEGLNVTSAATSSGEGSLITSKSRNVRLDGGTQMLLTTSANSASQAGGVSEPGTAGSLSGTAAAAGSASGAVKRTGDSGADKGSETAQQPPPDATDKR